MLGRNLAPLRGSQDFALQHWIAEMAFFTISRENKLGERGGVWAKGTFALLVALRPTGY